LEDAIEFYCTDSWKKATEIGRTGLADLRVAFGDKFAPAAQKHLSAITKRYAELLNA
jgi:hypothetical protein